MMILRCEKMRCLVLTLIALLGLSSLRRYGYEPVFGEIQLAGISHRFIRGFSEMGLGCLVALWCQRHREWGRNSRYTSWLEWASLTVALLGPFAPIWRHPGCISLLVLNDALLVVLFMNGFGVVSRFFNRPCWGVVSQYALALYCTHYVTTLAIPRLGLQGGLLIRSVVACGAVLISFGLAVLAHKWIEMPCARYLQSRGLNKK